MLNVIQEQSCGLMFLLVLGITAPVATAVLCATHQIARRCPDVPFGTMIPSILALGIVTGLLLGFVFQRAWEGFDVATKSVNQEVIQLGQIASASSFLSDEHAPKVLEGVKAHLRHVLSSEWPQMATIPGPSLQRAPGLAAVKAALMFTPHDERERLGQQFILSSLSEAAAARSNRIRASHFLIARPLWWTIVGLSVLLLVGVALSTSVNIATSALSVGLCTISLSLILTTILGFDRPFVGGITVSNEPMRELLEFLSREK